MFRDDRFSAWDEDGIPTKTKEGEEVTKNALKKRWDLQKKAHEEWKAKNGL
jgi:cysteinyl-tRNA synthetase